jgi:diguanylate cyclase (GGDEF)-like protein
VSNVRSEVTGRPTTADHSGDRSGSDALHLHESIASLHASRGQWELAYHHLRSAFDLAYGDPATEPAIPEQVRREVEQLRREHAEAREQSIRDGLTDSYNRRYLDQRLVNLLDEAHAARRDVAVALVDLDWFKQVNDTFGHLVGDAVLRKVVGLLTAELPADGFCARYGGEEFVLVFPGVGVLDAVELAECCRARVEHHPWSTISAGLRITVSVGLAHDPATGAARSAVDAEHQLLEADTLLYAAKQSGRNAVAYRGRDRVCLAGAAAGRRLVTQPS